MRRKFVYGVLVFIVALVVAVAIPLYSSVAPRARIAKAQADLRTLQAALQAYADHCGGLPPIGDVEATDCPTARSSQFGSAPFALLSAQRNTRGEVKGAFVATTGRGWDSALSLPAGWQGSGVEHLDMSVIWRSWKYSPRPDGTYSLCAEGDGYVVSSRGGTTCP